MGQPWKTAVACDGASGRVRGIPLESAVQHEGFVAPLARGSEAVHVFKIELEYGSVATLLEAEMQRIRRSQCVGQLLDELLRDVQLAADIG